MRKIVDSNMLRNPVLGAWLRRSESNVAVLTDYLAMEALNRQRARRRSQIDGNSRWIPGASGHPEIDDHSLRATRR